MNLHSPTKHDEQTFTLCRRQHEGVPHLILNELDPLVVIDRMDGDDAPLPVLSFGNVRECCPKCQQASLRLVLRQESVRMAHLFCAECESCFDACYADGAPALTI